MVLKWSGCALTVLCLPSVNHIGFLAFFVCFSKSRENRFHWEIRLGGKLTRSLLFTWGRANLPPSHYRLLDYNWVEGQMFAAKDHEEFEAFATGLFSNRPLVFIDEYRELYVVYV